MIGEVQADGQFSIVYQSQALPPKAWSPYVEANKDRAANWSWPWVYGGCTKPKFSAFWSGQVHPYVRIFGDGKKAVTSYFPRQRPSHC